MPRDGHKLTTNGPYLDFHLGEITDKAPVGQTYYFRPLDSYDVEKRTLTIYTTTCKSPVIHFNTNTPTDKIGCTGSIVISDVSMSKVVDGVKTYTFGKESKCTSSLTIYNDTGLALQGFHVHDGASKNGATSFGPISLFLYTTKYWQDKKSTNPSPLPPGNISPVDLNGMIKLSKEMKDNLEPQYWDPTVFLPDMDAGIY
tara:strand:+ start:152 stop:751 length:600 start_codon:yes stop_codon:yes gene_type:complete